jgi:nifR3 family TIM-barrel protein
MVKIGPIELRVPVVLAPMAGVTNAPYRRLCREFGGGLYVSEMISARAICEGSEKTMRLASFDEDESPRSLQLAAVDPFDAGKAVELLVSQGKVDHIDMNFGCPVRKITRNGGGAALPYKRKLYAQVVGEAVKAAGTVPVTVKFRVGIDDAHQTFLDAGRIAADLGVAALALHGRTAAQLYSGQADWDTIGQLVEAVPEIPVFGNGDIWEANDALAMMDQTGCAGVVIGRGCLGRPWLFGQLEAALNGEPQPAHPTTQQVAKVMATHAASLQEWFGGDKGVREFRKHSGWYLKGYPVGGALRARFSQVSSLSELDDLLAEVPTADLPPENYRVARGHTRGPQQVALPDQWLMDPMDDARANPEGGNAASGG